MNDSPVSTPPLRRNPAAVIVLTLAVLLLLTLAWPMYADLNGKANQSKAISNCRQIVTTLRLYSSDNSGVYPDALPKPAAKPRTANEAFRQLFIGGECDNEMIFGCPDSPFKPDGNIGNGANHYAEAVKKGENHWAMTAGLDDSADGAFPLIYENPADAALPPHWDTSVAGQAKPGRCWADGRIVVGFNDSSVKFMPVEADPGADLGLLKPFDADQGKLSGKPIFFGADPTNARKMSILQVEQ
jgi:hypothetical protein